MTETSAGSVMYIEDKDHLFAEVIRSSYAKWLVSVPRWDVSTDTSIVGAVAGSA